MKIQAGEEGMLLRLPALAGGFKRKKRLPAEANRRRFEFSFFPQSKGKN
jgi:hypothetical protein